NITVLRSSFLAGPSTVRVQVEALRPLTNFLTRPLLGLAIRIHGSERRGRRARDWRSSSRIVEPYWLWTAFSPFHIRLVDKKDGCVILRSRRFCVSLLLSTRGSA